MAEPIERWWSGAVDIQLQMKSPGRIRLTLLALFGLTFVVIVLQMRDSQSPLRGRKLVLAKIVGANTNDLVGESFITPYVKRASPRVRKAIMPAISKVFGLSPALPFWVVFNPPPGSLNVLVRSSRGEEFNMLSAELVDRHRNLLGKATPHSTTFNGDKVSWHNFAFYNLPKAEEHVVLHIYESSLAGSGKTELAQFPFKNPYREPHLK